MYKTAVYTLVNGGITHQKQQKCDVARQHIDTGSVMLRNITSFIFPVFV